MCWASTSLCLEREQQLIYKLLGFYFPIYREENQAHFKAHKFEIFFVQDEYGTKHHNPMEDGLGQICTILFNQGYFPMFYH